MGIITQAWSKFYLIGTCLFVGLFEQLPDVNDDILLPLVPQYLQK